MSSVTPMRATRLCDRRAQAWGQPPSRPLHVVLLLLHTTARAWAKRNSGLPSPSASAARCRAGKHSAHQEAKSTRSTVCGPTSIQKQRQCSTAELWARGQLLLGCAKSAGPSAWCAWTLHYHRRHRRCLGALAGDSGWRPSCLWQRRQVRSYSVATPTSSTPADCCRLTDITKT